MKDEDISFDKYYLLATDHRYFSVDLQRNVFFDTEVVVKPTHKADSYTGRCLWFGKLVETMGSVDYDTDNEIEFLSSDVISEYEFKDIILPLLVPLN